MVNLRTFRSVKENQIKQWVEVTMENSKNKIALAFAKNGADFHEFVKPSKRKKFDTK